MIRWLAANWGWLTTFLIWVAFCVGVLVYLARANRGQDKPREQLHTDIH